MATAYARLRVNWGCFDITLLQSTTPGYSAAQIQTGGPSAVIGSGVGVRRATLVLDRTGIRTDADVAIMHFDFLNVTAGNADDTWTTTDFTTLEGYIQTFMTAMKPYLQIGISFTEIDWHRVGTGVSKPNPAERQLILATPIAGTGSSINPPQVACSLTFRTGVRKSWGRTYMPYGAGLTGGSKLASGVVDTIATALNTMVTSAASADMHLVVVSKPLSSSLNVERIEVDDNLDVIRRRRWKKSTYRKLLP
jgi:hypothetical protein